MIHDPSIFSSFLYSRWFVWPYADLFHPLSLSAPFLSDRHRHRCRLPSRLCVVPPCKMPRYSPRVCHLRLSASPRHHAFILPSHTLAFRSERSDCVRLFPLPPPRSVSPSSSRAIIALPTSASVSNFAPVLSHASSASSSPHFRRDWRSAAPCLGRALSVTSELIRFLVERGQV